MAPPGLGTAVSSDFRQEAAFCQRRQGIKMKLQGVARAIQRHSLWQ
jgi:hypothetical protein